MMKLRFDKRFPEDLAEAIEWYRQVSPEACRKLRTAVQQRITSIRMFPESFQLLTTRQGHRGSPIPGFPWMIVFRIENDIIRLLRIVHLASDWHRS